VFFAVDIPFRLFIFLEVRMIVLEVRMIVLEVRMIGKASKIGKA